jgi:hypothetical protein
VLRNSASNPRGKAFSNLLRLSLQVARTIPPSAGIEVALIMLTPALTRWTTKPTRTNKNSIEEETNRALLKVLLSPKRHLQFARFGSESNKALFDNASTPKLREKIRNRRRYLLHLQANNFSAFLNLCAA